MSDLISRSALKEKAFWTIVANGAELEKIKVVSVSAIDNAPTVEPQVVPIANVTFDTEKLKEFTDEIVERIKSGEIVLQEERLKGEWIAIEPYSHKTFCSICKIECDCWDITTANFCPNCGADMRGEDK